MTVTVTYIQLNKNSCIRETHHDDELVSTETLNQEQIPLQVQRLMLMRLNQTEVYDPTLKTLVNQSPEEIYRMAEDFDRR